MVPLLLGDHDSDHRIKLAMWLNWDARIPVAIPTLQNAGFALVILTFQVFLATSLKNCVFKSILGVGTCLNR